MLARLSLAALCAALAATSALAGDEAGFTCTGVFGIDGSEALVIQTYGAGNVETGDVPGPEGTTVLATTVFPGDPDRAIEFGWWDEENLTDPSYANLAPGMAGPKGVRVGMSVSELEELNGEPFTLTGFGWDYGGYAGFPTGNLADLPGGCIVGVRLAPGEYPSDLDVNAVMGDREVVSGEPLLRQIDARVQSVTIAYPHPDFRD